MTPEVLRALDAAEYLSRHGYPELANRKECSAVQIAILNVLDPVLLWLDPVAALRQAADRVCSGPHGPN